MELKLALSIANSLILEHGLTRDSWYVSLDNAQKRMGVCRSWKRELSFSRKMIARADEEFFRQVVLHEIAHALVHVNRQPFAKPAAHGPEWKREAKSIGYVGGRTINSVEDEGPLTIADVRRSVEDARASRAALSNSADGAPVEKVRFPRGTHLRMNNGVEGEIVDWGRTRYKVRDYNGVLWTTPFYTGTKIDPPAEHREAAAATVSSAPSRLSPKVRSEGDKVTFRGQEYEVVSVGRSRYKIKDRNGRLFFLGFSAVA